MEVYQLWSEATLGTEAASPAVSTLRRIRVRVTTVWQLYRTEPDDPGLPTGADGADLAIASDSLVRAKYPFEQLQRLARHPYSAEWADRAIAQSHALIERDSLDGDDVQTILATIFAAQPGMRCVWRRKRTRTGCALSCCGRTGARAAVRSLDRGARNTRGRSLRRSPGSARFLGVLF